MKATGCFLLVALVILISLEVALPSLAGEIVAERAPEITRTAIGIALTPVNEVRVSAVPALKLLAGLCDSVSIDAGPLMFAGYPVDLIKLEAKDVQVNLSSMRSGQQARIERHGASTVSIYMSEDSVNRAIEKQGLPFTSPNVVFGEGTVRVAGRAQMASITYNLGLLGRLAVLPNEPKRVYFLVDDLEINGQKASPILSGSVRRLVGDRILLLDLRQQNIPLAIKHIDITRRQITLITEVQG